MKTTSIIKLAGLLLPCTFTAFAQKLPNKQEASLFAPAKVKIDGKTTEWGDKFQAYNKATELFSTIANDNDNLYLTVQATESLIARKIIAGGLTLSINSSDKTKKNEKVNITYPVFDKKNPPSIYLNRKTDDLDQLEYDIYIYELNEAFDTAIAIYNEHNIKAMGAFNDKKHYTYELALPLKFIKPLINNLSTINYNITLNGSTYMEGARIEYLEGGGIRITSPGTSAPSMADMKAASSPTYFSGEYTLAKKITSMAKQVN
ncbi:MAG: hypothetical protein EOP47_05750 [Sphingobacteriaceae bacterium]|nr:MAG: hypothetical protein EOP47_05750 [Sphingobacteriaceae bacterium]